MCTGKLSKMSSEYWRNPRNSVIGAKGLLFWRRGEVRLDNNSWQPKMIPIKTKSTKTL